MMMSSKTYLYIIVRCYVGYFIWKILLIHHNNQDLILDNLIKPISKFHINQLSELSQTINIHYTVYYQWTMNKISEE